MAMGQSKLIFIQSFIDRCNEIIEIADVDKAKQLLMEIIGTFDSDIKNIKSGLDSFSEERRKAVFFGRPIQPVNYVNELKIVKLKLEKLKIELETPAKNGGPLISLTQIQNQTTNVQVDFDVTVSAIENIPDSSLSQEDKEILFGKLTSLKGCSDKETKWDKSKGILKWLADKGVDVAIAVLPYVVNVLKNGL